MNPNICCFLLQSTSISIIQFQQLQQQQRARAQSQAQQIHPSRSTTNASAAALPLPSDKRPIANAGTGQSAINISPQPPTKKIRVVNKSQDQKRSDRRNEAVQLLSPRRGKVGNVDLNVSSSSTAPSSSIQKATSP